MMSRQTIHYEFAKGSIAVGMGNGLHRIGHSRPRIELVATATSCDTYRIGFNGKELDNEIQGDGNSYDFGARIFDSRLERWLSLDPLMAKYPNWSHYKAFLDNPIIYSDPDGKTEFLTITVYNQNTGKTFYITVATSNKVFKGTTNMVSTWPHKGTFSYETPYFNKQYFLTLEMKDGKIVSTTVPKKPELLETRVRTTVSGDNPPAEKRVNDSKQPYQLGGLYLYNEGGGADPTKYKSIYDADKVDADLILGVVGAIGASEFSALPKGLKAVPDMISAYKDSFEVCKDVGKEIQEKEAEKHGTPSPEETVEVKFSWRKKDGSGGTGIITTSAGIKRKDSASTAKRYSETYSR